MTPGDLVRVIKTTAMLRPCGTSHHWCRHADELVERARALRAAGQSVKRIGLLLGLNHATVADWVANPPRRRRPPVRVVVKRVKHRTPDRLSAVSSGAPMIFAPVRSAARTGTPTRVTTGEDLA